MNEPLSPTTYLPLRDGRVFLTVDKQLREAAMSNGHEKSGLQKPTVPIPRMPALAISSEEIRRIAKRGQESPFGLSPADVYKLCNAVVAATKL